MRMADIPSQRQLRILVVEDHADTLKALSRYLRLHGHFVTEASDMGSARKQLQESEHDLLLCDKHLPDGDGWTLLKETDLRQGSIYAVAMSAGATKQDVTMAAAAGYIEYMAKPFAIGQLDKVVRNALAHGTIFRN